jgi:hypothetical protein
MSRGSLCVCTVGLRGFHHCKESTLAFPVLVTEQTLNSTGLTVYIEDQHGLSDLLLGYCWMVVYCGQKLGADSPSWSYDDRVGLIYSHCLCY